MSCALTGSGIDRPLSGVCYSIRAEIIEGFCLHLKLGISCAPITILILADDIAIRFEFSKDLPLEGVHRCAGEPRIR